MGLCGSALSDGAQAAPRRGSSEQPGGAAQEGATGKGEQGGMAPEPRRRSERRHSWNDTTSNESNESCRGVYLGVVSKTEQLQQNSSSSMGGGPASFVPSRNSSNNQQFTSTQQMGGKENQPPKQHMQQQDPRVKSSAVGDITHAPAAAVIQASRPHLQSRSSRSYSRGSSHDMAGCNNGGGGVLRHYTQLQLQVPSASALPVVDPPMDCTEIESYYEEDNADYMDYVRRWEEQKEAETRAEQQGVRVQRSLFFGLAALRLQEHKEATMMRQQSSQPFSTLEGASLMAALQQKMAASSSSSLASVPSSPAGTAMTKTMYVDLPHSLCTSPMVLSPREEDEQEEFNNGAFMEAAPIVPHIAQTSMLGFMSELIAESAAIGAAAATAAAAQAARNNATSNPCSPPLLNKTLGHGNGSTVTASPLLAPSTLSVPASPRHHGHAMLQQRSPSSVVRSTRSNLVALAQTVAPIIDRADVIAASPRRTNEHFFRPNAHFNQHRIAAY